MDASERKKLFCLVSRMEFVSAAHRALMLKELTQLPALSGLTPDTVRACAFLTDREKQNAAEVISGMDDCFRENEKAEEMGIRFVGMEDAEFPRKLLQLPDCPAGLYVRGKLPGDNVPCAAIVGARACSAYGSDCAEWFARTLSEAGVAIVSGMAYGIDSAAQKSALEGKGGSFAVLAGGADLCYPKENAELYRKLCSGTNGGVISEMPPGTPHLSYLFPRRNRIISGMSDAVVVVEARERSGSLITAEFAADQGRLVYAVPGDIRSGLSAGCSRLIRQGATLLSSPEELLEDLRMTTEAALAREFARGKVPVTGKYRDVYLAADRKPRHTEELLKSTGYPAGDLQSALLWLEINGYLIQYPKNYYRKTALLPPE